jgi:hypothetical protein
MTLQASIELLTREHKTAAQTIDGLEFHTRPALLHLLREAIFGGMEATGGSSMKAKLPISEGALDLYELIDHQIAEAWAQSNTVPPNTDRPETLAAQWSALVDPDAIIIVTHAEQHERWDDTKDRLVSNVIRIRTEYTAETLAARWVTMIEEFFDPPRSAEIPAPCVICGERYVERRKDGESGRTSAMVFIRDRYTGETLRAECQHCGRAWAPDQFDWFAGALGIDVAKKRAEHEEREQAERERAEKIG